MNEFMKLQNSIMQEEHMDRIPAAIMTSDILHYYSKTVKEALLKWADGIDVSDFAFEDTTVADIQMELECSVFQALLIINSLINDPDSLADAVLVEWRDMIL